VARLFGDQRQQQQFQVTGGEHPWAASAAFAAGAFLSRHAAVAVFAVRGNDGLSFVLLSSCLDTT
jgi:hypothetical protein